MYIRSMWSCCGVGEISGLADNIALQSLENYEKEIAAAFFAQCSTGSFLSRIVGSYPILREGDVGSKIKEYLLTLGWHLIGDPFPRASHHGSGNGVLCMYYFDLAPYRNNWQELFGPTKLDKKAEKAKVKMQKEADAFYQPYYR